MEIKLTYAGGLDVRVIRYQKRPNGGLRPAKSSTTLGGGADVEAGVDADAGGRRVLQK